MLLYVAKVLEELLLDTGFLLVAAEPAQQRRAQISISIAMVLLLVVALPEPGRAQSGFVETSYRAVPPAVCCTPEEHDCHNNYCMPLPHDAATFRSDDGHRSQEQLGLEIHNTCH